MNLRENKLFKNKWISIIAMIFIYLILMVAIPRVTGYFTIMAVIVYGIYLFKKNDKFKTKAKWIKVLSSIGLAFLLIFGAALTSITPQSIEQSKLAAEKAKIEKQNELATEQKAKDEQAKKQADEKAKQEESASTQSTSQDQSKTPEVSETANTTVSGQLKVSFINVGQADSILVQQGNSNMLIDAGNNGDSQTIKSYLDSQGVKSLDVVVGTHAHEDHIGSMDYIINTFKIGKIYFPKQTATTKTFQDFVNAVKNKGLQLTAPTVGESFKLGDTTATILAPNGSGYEDANDYSIVVKLSFGNTSFLLTGDAEARSESEMLAKGLDLSATVLKVGHHGSKTSTSQAFLDKVNPKYAVISVGKDNSYGHPTQETLNRLKSKGVTVYRTDENGTVVATSDGKNVSFNTQPGSYNGVSSIASNSSNVASSNSNESVSNSSDSTSTTPPAKVNPTPSPSQDKSVTVYVTNTGKKYHVAGCRYLSKSKIPINLKDAKAEGYEPCSVCHPPQ